MNYSCKVKSWVTHHQQSKQNDPTAPNVCFPSVILLSLTETRQSQNTILLIPDQVTHPEFSCLTIRQHSPGWLQDTRSEEICEKTTSAWATHSNHCYSSLNRFVLFSLFYICTPIFILHLTVFAAKYNNMFKSRHFTVKMQFYNKSVIL